jgi:hypothetical protein
MRKAGYAILTCFLLLTTACQTDGSNQPITSVPAGSTVSDSSPLADPATLTAFQTGQTPAGFAERPAAMWGNFGAPTSNWFRAPSGCNVLLDSAGSRPLNIESILMSLNCEAQDNQGARVMRVERVVVGPNGLAIVSLSNGGQKLRLLVSPSFRVIARSDNQT